MCRVTKAGPLAVLAFSACLVPSGKADGVPTASREVESCDRDGASERGNPRIICRSRRCRDYGRTVPITHRHRRAPRVIPPIDPCPTRPRPGPSPLPSPSDTRPPINPWASNPDEV